ncbi:MAG: sulfatase-like hydrolase/transferase [Candidatus Aenigmatarchaeota archaeon]
MSIKRTISFILIISIALISIFALKNFSKNKHSQPNIILISVDALRADHLPCYEYHRNTTPYICEFSEDSVLFKNTYSQGGCTPISISSLVTSKWPVDNGVRSWKDRINKNITTVFEKLRGQGYNTFFYTDMLPKGCWEFLGPEVNIRKFENPVDLLDNVESNLKDSYGNFYYIHLFGGHIPYILDMHGNRERFNEGIDIFNETIVKRLQDPGYYSSDEKENIYKNLTPEEKNDVVQYMINRYDEKIWNYDLMLGSFLESLRKMNKYNESIIILTADHGESFDSHNLYFDHGSIYNEVLRVPLIIKFPDNEYSNMEIEKAVRHIDVLPTIYSILEIEEVEEIEGKNLVQIFDNKKHNLKIYSNYRGAHSFINGKYKYIYRNISWKINFMKENEKISEEDIDVLENNINNISKIEELYNIEKDPKERENLVTKRPEIKDKLHFELFGILKNSKNNNFNVSEEIKRNLKDLGYADVA